MYKRQQYNVRLRPNSYISSLSEVQDGFLPLFWVEESGDLGDQQLKRIRTEVIKPLKGYKVIQWLVVGMGLVLVMLASGYCGILVKRGEASQA